MVGVIRFAEGFLDPVGVLLGTGGLVYVVSFDLLEGFFGAILLSGLLTARLGAVLGNTWRPGTEGIPRLCVIPLIIRTDLIRLCPHTGLQRCRPSFKVEFGVFQQQIKKLIYMCDIELHNLFSR